MDIHRDVVDVVNKVVLRDVVQIHGTEIPYPAELWVDGKCVHSDGTAMFSIGDGGLLTAEYFAYDNVLNSSVTAGIVIQRLDVKLIMKDTRVEIPTWWISNSPKARTRHNVPMPVVVAYKCEIQGRLGNPDSEMKSVSMTIAGLPDIHLGQVTTFIPEEDTAVENLTRRGFKKQIGVLRLEAGEWNIELTASHADDATDAWRLHHINLSRKDGLPFVLGDDIDNGIINALLRFLAFQCGKWISAPTIVCNPVFSRVAKDLTLREGETSDKVLSAVRKFMASEDADLEAMDELNNSIQSAHGFEDISGADILGVYTSDEQATITFGKGDPTVKLVWVGWMSPRDISRDDKRTATEMQTWPTLFSEFWKQYNDERSTKRLESTISYYVNSSQLFYDGSIHQSLVAAQSTLEAIVRWWNGLSENFFFSRRDGERFKDHLLKAVCKAELGKDRSKTIDKEELSKVIDRATAYRNKIDHGHAVNLDADIQIIANCQMYYHNLARFLLLAKFGSRDTNPMGYFVGPGFEETQPQSTEKVECGSALKV